MTGKNTNTIPYRNDSSIIDLNNTPQIDREQDFTKRISTDEVSADPLADDFSDDPDFSGGDAQTKINQVNSKTKTLASKLVLGPCRKQAARVLLSDPRNGMQQALSYTVERLVADRIAESTSGWLSSLGGSSENASKVRNAIEFGSALMDAFKK